MRNIRLAKRTIIIVLMLLSTLLVSLIPVRVISLNKEESNNKPSGAYTFSSDTISKEEYDANQVFYINSEDGFYSFCESMREINTTNPYATTVDTKFTYETKTVCLTDSFYVNRTGVGADNANYFDRNLYYFKGTFDGQGHTIEYNIRITIGNNMAAPKTRGVFCDELASGGVIKNVRLRNLKQKNHSGYNKETVSGGIVGVNRGTIENCIVDGYDVISYVKKENCDVAPLAGYNHGVVRNCLVTGAYILNANNPGGLQKEGYRGNYFVAEAESSDAINCVFAATIQKQNSSSSYTDDEIEGDMIYGNYLMFEYSNKADATAYKYMTTDISTDLPTNKDRPYHELSPWYKYNSNCGYGGDAHFSVYLRPFIKWTEFTFSCNPTGAATLSRTKLIVPTDYKTVSAIGNTLKIYGITISATPTDVYGFSDNPWSVNGTVCVANFVAKYAKVKFATSTGVAVTPNVTSEVLVDLVDGSIQLEDGYAQSSGYIYFTYTKDGTTHTVKYNLSSSSTHYYELGNYVQTTSGDVIVITPNFTKKHYPVAGG